MHIKLENERKEKERLAREKEKLERRDTEERSKAEEAVRIAQEKMRKINGKV